MPTNPFRYTGPVGIDDLIDRDGEADELLRTAGEGNNSRLVAPRRFGKTSLLRRVGGEAAADGWTPVYVDFFGVVSVPDVAARVEAAYLDALTGPLSRWFAGVRRAWRPSVQLGGPPVPVSAGLSLEAQKASLEERLGLPARVYAKTGRRVLVVFDEFQDVLAAGPNTDAMVRSVIQHHGEFAAYIFAGSHFGMMTELFGGRRRAFYQQTRPVALPPLPPEETAVYLDGRFAATGKDVGAGLGVVLDTATGHPQRTMLLAHEVWDRTPPGGTADESTAAAGLAAALAGLSEEFRELWSRMPTIERQVLAALAQGAGPYRRSTPASTRGQATKATLDALLERGDVVQIGSGPSPRRPGYGIVDPLFAEWIRRGRADS